VVFDDGAERVIFSLNNKGNTSYSDIIIYAKETYPSVTYLDSTSALQDVNSPVNMPSDTGYSVAADISKFKNAKQGVFELKVTLPNGRIFNHEFGTINGMDTQKFFWIELKDSTFIVRDRHP
jgi:hypothetical protein